MAHGMIELDGSLGEGGGQILRTSLALSLVTGKPFHLRHVRAGRAKPGLQPQHLMCVRAAAQIGQASLRGASLGSTDLVFEPGAVTPGKYHFAIGTAGATSLVLHTVYLPLALAGAASEVTIDGGTHVKASPCFHFLDATWRPYMARCGLTIDVQMKRPGFYPRGGGLIHARIQPCAKPRAIRLTDWNAPKRATGFSAVAGLTADIARRQARRANYRLGQRGLDVQITEENWAGGPGTVLAIVLDTTPAPTLFFGLGERGKPAERVADEAVDQAIAFLDAEPAGMDPHSADQIILPLALAEGESRFPVSEVTMHLLTNADIISRFVDRSIRVHGEEGQPGSVEINGMS
jgi:RNA 3'-terminal phosphate cyclase (ATP)